MSTAIPIQTLEKLVKLSLTDIPQAEFDTFFLLIAKLQEVQGIDHMVPLISPSYEEVAFQTMHFLREDIVEELTYETQYYTVPKIL